MYTFLSADITIGSPIDYSGIKSVINTVYVSDAACSVDQISACKTAGKCKSRVFSSRSRSVIDDVKLSRDIGACALCIFLSMSEYKLVSQIVGCSGCRQHPCIAPATFHYGASHVLIRIMLPFLQLS